MILRLKKRSGEEILAEEFKGKVLIVVNTATGCGFTHVAVVRSTKTAAVRMLKIVFLKNI